MKEIIIKKRKELNMTQQELADILNVSVKTISKWETGRGLPDIGNIPLLAKTLRISIDELMSYAIEEDKKNKELGYNPKLKQRMNFAYLLFIFITIIANVTLQTTIASYRVTNRDILFITMLIITIVLFTSSFFSYLILRNNWITIIPNSIKEDIKMTNKVILTTYIMYSVILVSSFITLYTKNNRGFNNRIEYFLEIASIILVFEVINTIICLILYKINKKRK